MKKILKVFFAIIVFISGIFFFSCSSFVSEDEQEYSQNQSNSAEGESGNTSSRHCFTGGKSGTGGGHSPSGQSSIGG